MPIRIILHVRPIEEQHIRPFLGEETRKFFLSILPDDLVEEIRGIKFAPYAIKPLHPLRPIKLVYNNMWVVSPSDRLALEFDVIDPKIEELLHKKIVEYLHELITIELGGGSFLLEKIISKAVPFKALLVEYAPQTFTIKFQTPTMIGRKRHPIEEPYFRLFPNPRDICENLLKLWNKYSDIDPKINTEKFLDWVTRKVYVRHYKLRTREVTIEGKTIAGFKGVAGYIVRNTHKNFAHFLISLIRLGEISNIGVKRTYGCGVISLSICRCCDK